jgi:hypothetical protein
MNCPFSLSPHQIQGLDYSKLFPVIQWLVKSLLAAQQQLSKITRAQSLSYFETAFQAAGKEQTKIEEPEIPVRRFKFKSTKKLSDPVRVLSAIAEFNVLGKGFEGFIKGLGNKIGGQFKKADPTAKPMRHTVSFGSRTESLHKEEEDLGEDDFEEVSGKTKISAENMALIMSGQSSEINAAIRE